MTVASKTSMVIDGIAASEAIDSSGEILDVDGCDISDFESGVGVLNYEHRGDSAAGASSNDVIGKIIYSRKIFKKDDCEDKRQEAYWDHVKLPYIYIKARLFDGADHPGAIAAAGIIRDAVMHNEPILARFSIEGSTLKKEGQRLVRTIARKVALTLKPANKSAISGLISDPNGPKPITEKQGEKSLLAQLLEEAQKSEVPGQQKLGGYEMEYPGLVVDEDVRVQVKEAAVSLHKALAGGMPSGAPSTLIQGEALQREDSRLGMHKNNIRAALRDMGVEVMGKQAMMKFLKWRLPEVNEKFLDHFTDLVGDVRARGMKDALDKVMEKWEMPMEKAQKVNLANPAPEAPKKARAVRPKKEKPTAPMPVEQYKPTPEGTPPSDAPPLGRSKKGLVGGVLQTPKFESGLKLYDFGSDPNMLDILHADEPAATPHLPEAERQDILKYVHTPWNRAMQSWLVLNKMAKDGKLPPSVIAHAAIFAAMSPNTSVPIQELYYGHYMDFRQKRKDLFTNPQGISPEDAVAFHRHLNSTQPPEFFRGYYTEGPGKMKYGAEREATRAGHGTQAALKREQAQLVDRPQGKPLINYHQAHPFLTALHAITKDDGRSFVDYIMQQKQAAGPSAFMYGFGPKLARYMGLMAGMGNMIVPDRHMMRSLFNLSLDQKPEFLAAQDALAPVEGERLLRGLDNHFFDKNPAVKKVLAMHPEHFQGREQQAVGPAFWLHWLAYPHYEQKLGRRTENANAGTAHDPYWRSVYQIMNEEGVPHDLPNDATPWKKSEEHDSLPARVARATKRVEEQFGEGPASFFFYSFGAPALLHTHHMDQIPEQNVRKAEFDLIELHTMFKHDFADIEGKRLFKTMDYEGADEVYSVEGDYPIGRFYVQNGKLRILEDHEGILKQTLKNGPVQDNAQGIGTLIARGLKVIPESAITEGKKIDIGNKAPDEVQVESAPEEVEPGNAANNVQTQPGMETPPPIFDYMASGMRSPQMVEVKGSDVFMNGQKMLPQEVEIIMHNIQTGQATLRYRRPS